MAARPPGSPLCKDCPAEHAPGKSRCAACSERRRLATAELREKRKRRRLCTECGAPAAPNRQTKKKTLTTLCAQHQLYYAERTRSDRNRTT